RKVLDNTYSSLGHYFDFTSAGQTGWTTTGCGSVSLGLSSGKLRVSAGSSCAFDTYKGFVVTIGKPYTVTLDIDRTDILTMDVRISAGTSFPGTPITTFTNPANGTISYTFTPSSGQSNVYVRFQKISTENKSFFIDNLQIKSTGTSPYMAMVVMTSDYYPYGYQMPGRHTNDPNYRFGYNGMEKNAEMYGEGNEYSTEFRQYDPRLGRWMSLDPLMAKYPSMSPYVAFNDNPVFFIDPLGLEGVEGSGDGNKLTKQEQQFLDNKNSNGGTQIDEVEITPSKSGIGMNATPSDQSQFAQKMQQIAGLITKLTNPYDDGVANGLPVMRAIGSFKDPSKMGLPDMSASEMGHLLLDVAGLIPGLGEIADGVNGVWYALEGDYFNATISFASMIPIGGQLVSGLRISYKLGDEALTIVAKADDIADAVLHTADDVIAPNPPVCFIAGTEIATSQGIKNIEEIEVGDLVWAFDETTGEKALKVVYNTVVRQSNHLQKLIIGLDTIYTTDDHPFYVNGDWVKAMNLNIGDSMNLRNGGKLVLSEKSRIDTLVIVYNFAVSDYASYYVGNQQILVHNNGPCVTLKPLGLGSTGRTTARNLTEELAMKEIMVNPTLGHMTMKGKTMSDSRWLGWNKFEYVHRSLDGSKTTIHFVGKLENGVLKAVDDFKFKD
ncbi:MAG: polymorphic toxin-type HINT domain-containing protein, partial [Fluviicola sp.]